MSWHRAIALATLRAKGRGVVKIANRRLAFFLRGETILACNNRCPHEGYPLVEGTLDDFCVLTCNWHNWKFDLTTGETLIGGDRLRRYPVRVDGDDVMVEIVDAPAAERQERALANLAEAMDEHDYERIARELARHGKAGGDPREALRRAIRASHDRFEYGMSHAYAATARWLELADNVAATSDDALICFVESLGHIAWDSLREPAYPFATGTEIWDRAAFLAAIEKQDEAAALRRLRGALASDVTADELERVFAQAALAHYQDYGHSLIYVRHGFDLLARLGSSIAEPLLAALLRSLVAAYREDLLPEFRDYSGALRSFPASFGTSDAEIVTDAVPFRGVRDALAWTVDQARVLSPRGLHRALLTAIALDQMRFDLAVQACTDNAVAANVGWLDYTHGITFANALRLEATRAPELWPAGLLQMACFAGRGRRYVDATIRLADWVPADEAAFHDRCSERLFDHAERDYIHSAHLLKTYTAMREERATLATGSAAAQALLAAVHRFFNEPMKRKHVRRAARQALDFVAIED
jgi:nitrite reductase/ring-hydroxylating ferredoxin subunit